jgi:hypothetical protein
LFSALERSDLGSVFLVADLPGFGVPKSITTLKMADLFAPMGFLYQESATHPPTAMQMKVKITTGGTPPTPGIVAPR